MLEIGTFLGASAIALRKGLSSGLVMTVDLFPSDRFQTARENLSDAGCHDVVLMAGNSCDIGLWWKCPLNFLYIDGGHHENIVRSDLKHFTPHILSGGVVALHDCRPPAQTYHLEPINQEIERWLSPEWAEIEAPGTIRAFVRR